jgi:hypothetical protein
MRSEIALTVDDVARIATTVASRPGTPARRAELNPVPARAQAPAPSPVIS